MNIDFEYATTFSYKYLKYNNILNFDRYSKFFEGHKLDENVNC